MKRSSTPKFFFFPVVKPSVCSNLQCDLNWNTLVSTWTLQEAVQSNNWHIKSSFFSAKKDLSRVIKSISIGEEASIKSKINCCDCSPSHPPEKHWRTTTTKVGGNAPLSPQVEAELWLFYYFSPVFPDERPVFHPSSSGSALEGAGERIDCCTALCSERFLSALTPSQLSLWGRNLIRGKYHQSWWTLATTTPPTCCLLSRGASRGDRCKLILRRLHQLCFASVVQGELRECDCRGGGRVWSLYLLFSWMWTAECLYETKCAKKVPFENFGGGTLLVCDFRLQLAIILIIYLIRWLSFFLN